MTFSRSNLESVAFAAFLLILSGGQPVAANQYFISANIDPSRGEFTGNVRIHFQNLTGQPLTEIPILSADQQKILLDVPLAQGQTKDIEINFAGKLKRVEGGYWLLEGPWHPIVPGFVNGRFGARQREADSYEVSVTAPADQVVVSSGRKIAQETAGGVNKLRYAAENISNFGLAGAAGLLEAHREAAGVEIRSYYFPGDEKWGAKLADYAAKIIPFYAKTFGFYPQRTLAMLPGSKSSGGGYPPASNIIVVHRTLDAHDEWFPEWITSHEIGHQYWGFDGVLDEGDYYNWPGIPLGIYTDRLYSEANNPAAMAEYRGFVQTYLGAVGQGYDTRIRRTWDEIDKLDWDFNNMVAHGKGYAVIQMLEELMGRDSFFGFVQNLARSYRNRILSFQDFQQEAEKASGQKLDWFFSDWVEGSKVLSYAIERVEGSSVQVRRIGTAGMPLQLEVVLQDGERLRKKIDRNAEVQTLDFNIQGQIVRARLDPDNRTALYSPAGAHVWGRRLEVVDVKLAEQQAWGTNTAMITVRNTDSRPHEVQIDSQCRRPPRNFGRQTTEVVPANSQRVIAHNYDFPIFPGKVVHKLRVRDLTESLQIYARDYEDDFPLANSRTAALRPTPPLLKMFNLQRVEFPRLLMAERGHLVFYYLEGDRFVEGRIDETARTRERVYQMLKEKLNPAFDERVAIYFFPDAESKLVYTGHRGMGWATGNMLFEIFNEKEHVDPNHELVHIVAGSIGDPPALFNEGFAAYMQEGQAWDGVPVDAWVKAFEARHMLIPMDRLITFEEIGSDESKPGIAYPEAASIVKFLIARYGFEKFVRAYREMKSSSDAAGQNGRKFGEIFGSTPVEVEREWLATIQQSTIEPAPAGLVDAIAAKYK